MRYSDLDSWYAIPERYLNPDASLDDVTCPDCEEIALSVGLVWREETCPEEAVSLLGADENVEAWVRFNVDESRYKEPARGWSLHHTGYLVLTNQRLIHYLYGMSSSPFVESPLTRLRALEVEPDRFEHDIGVDRRSSSRPALVGYMRVECDTAIFCGSPFQVSRAAIEYFLEKLKAVIDSNITDTPNEYDRIEKLDLLFTLFTKGALSQDEYEREKAFLLGRSRGTTPPFKAP